MGYPIIVVPFMKPLGMALYPFILIKQKEFRVDKQLIQHEKIHLKQQAEMLILPFYVAYLVYYLINLIKYKDKDFAYREIVFEKEAYLYEDESDYLIRRKPWAWITLLKRS